MIFFLQVEDGMENYFTDEYKRFKMVLKETIEKNKNKRVVFYHRLVTVIRHRYVKNEISCYIKKEKKQQLTNIIFISPL